MSIKMDKISDIVYNQTLTLAVISLNKDLKDIFTEDVNASFNSIIALSKNNNLPSNVENTLMGIFDNVISRKSDLVELYLKVAKDNNISVGEDVKPVEIKTTKKKEKNLPRRYGKASIQKDIEKQNGKATNAQLTALAVNDLKNLYVKLNSRLIHDMLSDKKSLSDEDYREIRATINILKNKMKPILKK
jgi:hypothetical protein